MANAKDTTADPKAADAAKQEAKPPAGTVAMKRDLPAFPGGPTKANVSEGNVADMQKNGWVKA